MFIYPTSIYGFNEGNTEYKLSDEFLEEFKDVKCYISEIDSTEQSEIFYGIECEFEPHIGKFIITKEKKDIMKNLFHKVMDYKTNKDRQDYDNSNFIIPELGFYVCLGGDIDYSNYQTYTINEIVKKEDEPEYKYHDDTESEDSQFLNDADMNFDVTPNESDNFSD